MYVLEHLRELNEKITKLYCDMGSELIGPLLLEILDLPTKNFERLQSSMNF